MISWKSGGVLLTIGLLIGIAVNLFLNQIPTKVLAQRVPPVQPPTEVGTFKGFVQVADVPPDFTTQRLPGIKVFIHGTNLSTLTDSNGNFVINNVPVGKFVLVQAYRIDPNLPVGTGNSRLSNAGQFFFGAYIPKAGDTVDLHDFFINYSEPGAP